MSPRIRASSCIHACSIPSQSMQLFCRFLRPFVVSLAHLCVCVCVCVLHTQASKEELENIQRSDKKLREAGGAHVYHAS